MNLAYKMLLAPVLAGSLMLTAHAFAAAPAATPAAAPARGATNPPPTRMAVVNVVVLFDKLLEKADADDSLAAMKKKSGDKIMEAQGEIESLKKKLDSLNPDTPEFRTRQEELLTKAMNLEVMTKVEEAKYVNESFLRTRALYKKINEAVAEYSKQNGIGIVFVADAMDVDKLREPQQFQAIVTTRKIIYFAESFDITQSLITKMNTDFSLRTPPK